VKKLLAAAGVLLALAWLHQNGTVSQWAERAQRIPLPALRGAPARAAAAPAEPLEAREIERAELAVKSEVVALAEHGDALYAGTFDEGALRIERGGGRRRLRIDSRVNDLAVDEAGTVYAATNGGAWEVSAAGDPRRLAPGAFAAVALWRGRPVFASRGGLSTIEGTGLWTRGPAQGVRADGPTALADCGAVLCIGASDGLWLFDGASATRHSTASGELPEEVVTAVARGEDGDTWAGTLAGIARVSSAGAPLQPPVSDGRVVPHALLIAGGAAIFGTPSGLVVVRRGRAGLVRGLAPVTALASSARGGIWVGLRGAAVRVEIPEAVQALAEVRQ
jgi:ligand-binding sensor domain-containing protein